MGEISLGNLYDFNKSAMNQLNPLDEILFNKLTKEISQYLVEHGKYWMLLCHERRDYTVFNIGSDADKLAKELRPTLKNRGQVISIDQLEDDNYEIWIRDIDTKENFVYYLFDYNYGVIETD